MNPNDLGAFKPLTPQRVDAAVVTINQFSDLEEEPQQASKSSSQANQSSKPDSNDLPAAESTKPDTIAEAADSEPDVDEKTDQILNEDIESKLESPEPSNSSLQPENQELQKQDPAKTELIGLQSDEETKDSELDNIIYPLKIDTNVTQQPQLGSPASAAPDPATLLDNISTPIKRQNSHDSAARPSAEEDKAFYFQKFLEQMRAKSAAPVTKYIRSFLVEFSKTDFSAAEQTRIVQDFFKFINGKMREYEPFSKMDESRWENAQEGMEKLISSRIYSRTFSPKIPKERRKDDQQEDIARDQVFGEKMRLWKWIEPRHLDLPDTLKINDDSALVDVACQEIRKLNQYRACRDKMVCILNCSRVIWALVKQTGQKQNADTFLPILILIILRAQPLFLVSNLNYMKRFSLPGRLAGESGYYLSMVESAVIFITGVERGSLTIDESELRLNLEQAVDAERKRLKQRADLDEHGILESDAGEPTDRSAPALRGNSVSGQTPVPSSVISESAGILFEQFKVYANKIFEPDDAQVVNIDSSAHPQTGSRQASSLRRPHNSEGSNQQPNLLEASPEELAAQQASAEEYRESQYQREESARILKALAEMFPQLDSEVIEDVLREKGPRIHAAIDVCSQLVDSE